MNEDDQNANSRPDQTAARSGPFYPFLLDPLGLAHLPEPKDTASAWVRQTMLRSARLGSEQASALTGERGAAELAREIAGYGYSALSRLSLSCYALGAGRAWALSCPLALLGDQRSTPQSNTPLDALASSRWSDLAVGFDSRSAPWAYAAVDRQLAQRSGVFAPARVRRNAMANVVVHSALNFDRWPLVDALSDQNLPMIRAAYAEPASSVSIVAIEGPALLSRDGAGNNRLADVIDDAIFWLARRESQTPAGLFGAFHSVLCFDHPGMLERFPDGVFDGFVLLLPVSRLRAKLGREDSFESIIDYVRTAADACSKREGSAGSPHRLTPCELHETMDHFGLSAAAQMLHGGDLMQEGLEVAGSGDELARALRDEFERTCREALNFIPDGIDRSVISGRNAESGELFNHAVVSAGRSTLAAIDGSAAIERLRAGSQPGAAIFDDFNQLAKLWTLGLSAQAAPPTSKRPKPAL